MPLNAPGSTGRHKEKAMAGKGETLQVLVEEVMLGAEKCGKDAADDIADLARQT